MIELGQTVKCKITGFKGVATGRTEYLAGCDHILVQPPVKKDGIMPDAKWFDEPMVEIISKKKKVKQVARHVGGPIHERNLPRR